MEVTWIFATLGTVRGALGNPYTRHCMHCGLRKGALE